MAVRLHLRGVQDEELRPKGRAAEDPEVKDRRIQLHACAFGGEVTAPFPGRDILVGAVRGGSFDERFHEERGEKVAHVSQPFPIDRGDDGTTTPGSYKGLWLRLAESGTPVVTPVDGVVGVVCVGMRNSNQECAAWIQQVATVWAGQVSGAVRLVKCAVGGHAIERRNDPAFDAELWDDCVTRRIPAAGLRLDQVRVLYHKAANQFTTLAGGGPMPAYPDPGSDYAAFAANLGTFAARVPIKFPSVQTVYTSSRSYGGLSGSPGRGEPLSYEEGHALNRWLGQHRQVGGVRHGWGPYLWAPDCASGVTNRSGVCYDRGDFVADGVHPSTAGQLKIAGLIHARFLREAWYRR